MPFKESTNRRRDKIYRLAEMGERETGERGRDRGRERGASTRKT